VLSGKHLVVCALFREEARIPKKTTLIVQTLEKTVLPNGQLLQIFVIGFAGKTMTLSVDSSESIVEIKSKILDKTGNNKTHFYFKVLFIKILWFY